MSFRNREIESKLLVENLSLAETNEILRSIFPDFTRSVFGTSEDIYWTINGQEAQFIRLRRRDDGVQEITVKARDRGTNLDRLEVDILSNSSPDKVVRLLTAAFGQPHPPVKKTYWVYWVGESQHDTVCCYQVGSEVYIELETTSKSKLLVTESKVVGEFSRRVLSVRRAEGSLYEMYVKPGVTHGTDSTIRKND